MDIKTANQIGVRLRDEIHRLLPALSFRLRAHEYGVIQNNGRIDLAWWVLKLGPFRAAFTVEDGLDDTRLRCRVVEQLQELAIAAFRVFEPMLELEEMEGYSKKLFMERQRLLCQLGSSEAIPDEDLESIPFPEPLPPGVGELEPCEEAT